MKLYKFLAFLFIIIASPLHADSWNETPHQIEMNRRNEQFKQEQKQKDLEYDSERQKLKLREMEWEISGLRSRLKYQEEQAEKEKNNKINENSNSEISDEIPPELTRKNDRIRKNEKGVWVNY